MPGHSCILWVVLGVAFWLALAVIGHFAERSPPSPRPDLSTGLAAWLIRVYLYVVHRIRIEGRENLNAAITAMQGGEGGRGARGVIVTANHAAGIDPLLVQSAVPFFVRWLAASDTIALTVRPFVEFADVIFLTTGTTASGAAGGAGGELTGVRTAIRYLQGDPSHPLMRGRPGAVGVFPEGRIARRPGVITPFQPGVGLIVAKSKALVLPVVLKGVPIRDNTYASFFIPGTVTVAFMPPVDYAAMGIKGSAIAGELQGRYEKWVGPVVAPKGRGAK